MAKVKCLCKLYTKSFNLQYEELLYNEQRSKKIDWLKRATRAKRFIDIQPITNTPIDARVDVPSIST